MRTRASDNGDAKIVLKPSMTAATTKAIAPTTTFAMFFTVAPSSSRNSTLPQNTPMSGFAFHSGKATARPT